MSVSNTPDSMVQVQGLTADTLLGAPRRSPAVPNRIGTLAHSTFSTFDFKTGTSTKEINIVDLETTELKLLTADEEASNVNWVPGTDDELLYVWSGEGGEATITAARLNNTEYEHYEVMKSSAPLSNLKLKQLCDGSIAFAVTALAGPDGQPFNKQPPKPRSTGRIYDNANIRLWDEYYKAETYSLFYGKLVKQHGRWTAPYPLQNLLRGTKLEPFGLYGNENALDCFDIDDKGIAFIARDPTDIDYSRRLFTYPFFSSIDSFTKPPTKKPILIHLDAVLDPGGIAENIRIAPDGDCIAYMFAPDNDPYNVQLYATASLEGNIEAHRVETSFTQNTSSLNDYPADSFEFLGDSKNIVFQKRLHGRTVLEYVDLGRREVVLIQVNGSVQEFYPLNNHEWNKLLVTSSNFIDNSLWQVVDVCDANVIRTISSATKDGLKFGLSKGMASEIWLRGADDVPFHSWVIVPKDFDPKKKYPWIVSLHGGPVSASSDSWSVRWHETAWAEQGYIVFCPNFTGSAGFGIEFIRRVSDSWGGRPYEDISKLVAHLETLPYIDQKKGVLHGASYGAYLVGLILSRSLADKFCCALWNNGIFSIPTFCMQTDYPPDNVAFGLRSPYPWNNMAGLDKYNPARPDVLGSIGQHAPPTLIMHGEKDFRCPMTEGLGLFNTLQAQGVPSRFLAFEDEGHWILNNDNLKFWYETAWKWAKRCVDGEITRESKTW